MGRYTDLARKHTEGAQEGEPVLYSNNVNINNIHSNRVSSIGKPTSVRPEDTLQGLMSVEMSQGVATDDKNRAESRDKGATTLRPTTLTTLIEGEEVWIATPPDPHRYTKLARKYAAERCIHELPLDRCAVCNGYARWLVAGGEERLSEARSSPESTRRLYWRLIDGGEVRERSW